MGEAAVTLPWLLGGTISFVAGLAMALTARWMMESHAAYLAGGTRARSMSTAMGGGFVSFLLGCVAGAPLTAFGVLCAAIGAMGGGSAGSLGLIAGIPAGLLASVAFIRRRPDSRSERSRPHSPRLLSSRCQSPSDANYVRPKVGDLAEDADLSKFIL